MGYGCTFKNLLLVNHFVLNAYHCIHLDSKLCNLLYTINVPHVSNCLMSSEFQSEAMNHRSKNITSPTLSNTAQLMPVPSHEDGPVWPSLQSMPPDVGENSTCLPISTSNSIHEIQNDTSIPSKNIPQKIKRKRGASSVNPKGTGLSKKKRVDTSPKCGTSGNNKNIHIDQSLKPGLQSDHHHEIRPEKDEGSEVQCHNLKFTF